MKTDVETPQLSGATDVTARLREGITSGRFMPNERLIEADLAVHLNTNRGNIRTALALLEQEGLVVRQPNRGARVRLVSDKEAVEIAEARGALEVLAARQAAKRASPADCDKLKSLLDDMRTAFDAGDLITFSGLNARLHREIMRIADNMTVSKILESLKSQLVRLQYRAILLPGRATNSMGEHQAIVEAICDGDEETAGQKMHLHLASVIDALRRAIEAYNQADSARL